MTQLKYSPFLNNLDYTGLSAVVDDPNPTLGGDLDVNGYSIISISNGDIPISPNGTGQVIIDGERWPQIDGAANTVLTTDGAGNLSWAAFAPGSFNWVSVTSALNPITITDLTGYIVKGAGAVVFKLPAASAMGLNSRIIGTTNLWSITQNAAQSIQIGVRTTTVGVSGSIVATVISDCVEIVCITANTEFVALPVQGNVTVN